MSFARQRYPSEYDWRYMTVSSLVYADRNPRGYLWARAGLALCGISGMYWTALRIRAAGPPSSATRFAGMMVMGTGYLSMTCCAVLFGVPRGHDLLALVGFIGVCAGLALTTFEAAARGSPADASTTCRRFRAAILSSFALVPIVLAALTQAYVSHALPALPWVGLTWRARGVPVYLSFAFWEWMACAVFTLYVLVLSAGTPASSSPGCSSA